jgi:hypothetical protein
MPFIGNQPALSYISFAKQDFTTSATTSYTLDNPVANENEIALFINFVRQEPTTAYTASGTSLTLTSATSASDDMYCVFLGKAVQTVNPPAGSVNTSQLADTSVTSSKINYPLTTFSSTGIDDNATSTAITIDSNETSTLQCSAGDSNFALLAYHPTSTSTRTIAKFQSNVGGTQEDKVVIQTSGSVGIGTTSPNNQLEIKSDTATVVTRLACNSGTGRDWGVASATDGAFGIYDYDATSYRMRIDSSGTLKTNSTATQCAEFDRKSNDGNLIVFLRDAAVAGTISVSGGIVSYNGFTGTHWSRFTDNSKPTILKGTVLESLDEMCDWYNLEFDITDEEGNITSKKIPHVLTDTQSNGDVITYNHEGTDYQATIVKEDDIKHMKSKVSDTTDAKNVYGVFNSWDEDGEGYNDFYVASVGSFVVRIKANETIAKGDLLQSNGDGTAKVQTDDNVKSSSFAKVLSTTVIQTYDDGSFIVPCSLMC